MLDTNVLVSGLLTPHGPPGRVVDLVLDGGLQLLIDDRIFEEYRSVLLRPTFEIDPTDVASLLDYVRTESVWVLAPPLGIDLPDPADLPFVEVASAGAAESLVTGNVRHFPARAFSPTCRVETPAEFIRRWTHEHGDPSRR